MDPHSAAEIQNRWHAFRLLAPYFGRGITARFVQKTIETHPEVTRIHNLIEGIYKPKGGNFAFSIASVLKNPYADRIEYFRDRSWSFQYSPKAGSLDSAVNRSLFNCMRDSEPVLVLKQLSDKTSPAGTTYKLLGLGLIEEFDTIEQLFRIREFTIEQFQNRVHPGTNILSDDLIETALQLESMEAWSPFATDERAVYQVSSQKRDAAFRNIVLNNYDHCCAVLGTKFRYDSVTEAQAAHIIGQEARGTDDPRNGLALSHTTRWAFDQGVFTISDQYEIQVHPMAGNATHQGFPIVDCQGKPIQLPKDESNLPHLEALEWHRKEVFGKFAR